MHCVFNNPLFWALSISLPHSLIHVHSTPEWSVRNSQRVNLNIHTPHALVMRLFFPFEFCLFHHALNHVLCIRPNHPDICRYGVVRWRGRENVRQKMVVCGNWSISHRKFTEHMENHPYQCWWCCHTYTDDYICHTDGSNTEPNIFQNLSRRSTYLLVRFCTTMILIQ